MTNQLTCSQRRAAARAIGKCNICTSRWADDGFASCRLCLDRIIATRRLKAARVNVGDADPSTLTNWHVCCQAFGFHRGDCGEQMGRAA